MKQHRGIAIALVWQPIYRSSLVPQMDKTFTPEMMRAGK